MGVSLNINIDRREVFGEVEKKTSYMGSRGPEGGRSYDSVRATSSDESVLERFFQECVSDLVSAFRRYLVSSGDISGNTSHYQFVLSLPSSFDTTQSEGLRADVRNYFVLLISGRWLSLTGNGGDSLLEDASATMRSLLGKLFYRKRPVRMFS